MNKIVFLFLVLSCAKQVSAANVPAYFGALRGEISNQLFLGTNSSAVDKKLIGALKKSLLLVDRYSATNLTVHTRTLGLVASTLIKTKASNVFDLRLQAVINAYYEVCASTSSNLVFPTVLSPVKLKSINRLSVALQGAATNANTILATKYLSLAAKRLTIVERFALTSPKPVVPTPGPAPDPIPSLPPSSLTPPPVTPPPVTPPPVTLPPVTLPPPSSISDLSQMQNNVFVAGEGFNTLQFAPNGKLGFIAWRGRDLIYRERNGSSWSERVIGSYGSGYSAGGPEEYRFQPFAALLFDSQSRAHILRQNSGSFAHHVQQNDGGFYEDSAIPANGSFSLITVAMGPGDKLHIAVVGAASYPALSYGSNKDGSWQWLQVTTIAGDPRGFLRQSYAPRWFSMAIDSGNNAHITYCPEFARPAFDGHSRPFSQLNYASNRGGIWNTQKINSTADDSGDCGTGASIAIAPDGEPAIANLYNERASTGSSQYNQLYYFKRDGSGNWSKQLVVRASAGYLAGDGDKGAGFAPYLRFDPRGRPNIAFCDDAAEHFAVWGQNEYAGNLRHIYLDGGEWRSRTIYHQGRAYDGQVVYAAMALSGGEMVFTGLERKTQWIDSRRANSDYKWFYIQSSLP